MPVEVHTESLKRRFVADWLSIACLLNLLVVLGAAILPLYIVWATGMWTRQWYQFEQPDLQYQDNLVVQLQGLRGDPAAGYRQPFTAMWTTSPEANDVLGPDVVRGMVVRSAFEDVNNDGLNDVLRISVSVPLRADESVLGASVVAYMNAELHDVTRMRMDGLLSASYASGVPGSRLILDGDLRLYQRAPLPNPVSGVYAPYLWSPLPALSGVTSPLQASPEGLLPLVAVRNYSLAYTPVVAPVWVPDPFLPVTSALDTSNLALVPRAFQLSLTARVPFGQVLVTPTIGQELKWGWVQYLSLLWVTIVLAWLLRRILFGCRIVDTTVLADAPRSLTKLHAA